jgi:hypothetical protein
MDKRKHREPEEFGDRGFSKQEAAAIQRISGGGRIATGTNNAKRLSKRQVMEARKRKKLERQRRKRNR